MKITFVKKILFCLICCLCSLLSFSQEKVIEKNGQKFYKHIVKKGETLYSLSKTYNVKIDEITINNPSLKEKGIQPSQELLIPAGKQAVTPLPSLGKSIKHKVEKGETVYYITKKYNITQDELIAQNPILEEIGLKVGQELSIIAGTTSVVKQEIIEKPTPSVSPEIKPEPVIVKEEGFTIKSKDRSVDKELKVGLFLPFYLAQNDSVIQNGETMYHKSEASFDIYSGFLMALDSLKQEGLSFSVYISDVKDSLSALKQAQKETFKDLDLIIGPLHQKPFEIMSQEAAKFNIPIVCPVPNTNKILLNNPNAFKVMPSQNTQFVKAGDYICKNYSKDKLIILDPGKKNEEFGKQLMSKFNLLHNFDERFIKDSAVYLSANYVNTDAIISKLSSTKKNILILTSEEVVYVSDFITKLYNSSKNYDVILFGPEIWKQFNNLDITPLQGLNTHLTSSVDWDDTKASSIHFKKKLQEKHGIVNSRYVLSGYNSAFYFLKFISQSNKISELPDYKMELQDMKFEFKKSALNNGSENEGCYIFKIQNFETLKVY